MAARFPPVGRVESPAAAGQVLPGITFRHPPEPPTKSPPGRPSQAPRRPKPVVSHWEDLRGGEMRKPMKVMAGASAHLAGAVLVGAATISRGLAPATERAREVGYVGAAGAALLIGGLGLVAAGLWPPARRGRRAAPAAGESDRGSDADLLLLPPRA